MAGEQYLSVAEILLALSRPTPNTPQFGLSGRDEGTVIINSHAMRLCGLAYSNDDVAARLNVFGPLAFGSGFVRRSSFLDVD